MKAVLFCAAGDANMTPALIALQNQTLHDGLMPCSIMCTFLSETGCLDSVMVVNIIF